MHPALRVFLAMMASGLLLGIPSAAQSPAQPDSLLKVLRRTAADTARVRLLLQISVAYAGSDSAQAWAYSRQAYALTKQRQLTTQLPSVFLGMARLLFVQVRLPEALVYCHRARRLSRHLGLLAPLAQSYRRIAMIRSKQGRMPAAFRAYRASLAVHRRIGDTLSMVKTYGDIGVMYERQGNYPQSLRASLMALRLSEQRTNGNYARVRIRTLRNIGALYSQQQDAERDLHYMQQAHRLLRQYPDPLTEVGLLTDLGSHYLDSKQDSVALRYLLAAERLWQHHGSQAPRREPADIYSGLGTLALRRNAYNQALAYLQRAAAQYQRVEYTPEYVDVLHTIAETYRRQRRYGAAAGAANRALVLGLRARYGSKAASSYELLASISAAAGDSAAAFRYQRRFQALHDSLFNTEKAAQLVRMNAHYEAEKKEAQIALLRHSAAAQQQARNLLAGGLAAVACLGAAVLWRYGLERRARRQLQVQELELAARNQELTQAQQQLRQSLGEKEVLLQEVHHRVKNNLQIIASRLALQALEHRGAPAVAAALRDGQNWVKSVALVHEMLHRADDLASVALQPFVEQLAAQLGRAFAGGGAGLVAVEVRAPGVHLGPAAAVPLGLVVNELLSNAYKHAFAGGRAGRVLVALDIAADGAYRLRVRDDGAGLPPGFSLDATASLGLRLVRGLVRQLEGTLEVRRLAVGTEFCLTFTELTQPIESA